MGSPGKKLSRPRKQLYRVISDSKSLPMAFASTCRRHDVDKRREQASYADLPLDAGSRNLKLSASALRILRVERAAVPTTIARAMNNPIPIPPV